MSAVTSDPLTSRAPSSSREHPVGVAVEGEPEVRPALKDGRAKIGLVLRLDGVGRMVREGAVQVHVQRDERGRQPFEQRRDHQPGHPVGRVGRHGQRRERRQVGKRQQVIEEFLSQIGVRNRPGGSGGRLGRVQSVREVANLGQPRLLADRRGAGPAQLEPVVLGRVVARREHGARAARGGRTRSRPCRSSPARCPRCSFPRGRLRRQTPRTARGTTGGSRARAPRAPRPPSGQTPGRFGRRRLRRTARGTRRERRRP